MQYKKTFGRFFLVLFFLFNFLSAMASTPDHEPQPESSASTCSSALTTFGLILAAPTLIILPKVIGTYHCLPCIQRPENFIPIIGGLACGMTGIWRLCTRPKPPRNPPL